MSSSINEKAFWLVFLMENPLYSKGILIYASQWRDMN